MAGESASIEVIDSLATRADWLQVELEDVGGGWLVCAACAGLAGAESRTQHTDCVCSCGGRCVCSCGGRCAHGGLVKISKLAHRQQIKCKTIK